MSEEHRSMSVSAVLWAVIVLVVVVACGTPESDLTLIDDSGDIVWIVDPNQEMLGDATDIWEPDPNAPLFEFTWPDRPSVECRLKTVEIFTCETMEDLP